MEGDKEYLLKKRYSIKIFGVVQGVGYRPYVYNQASLSNIKGWVSNEGSALIMDIEGKDNDLKEFLLKVVKKPPSLAAIEKVKVVSKGLIGYRDFSIKPSSVEETELKFIPNDVATCSDCLEDIFDSKNPRYHYPFTNCTSCGPRYSIIRELPYDRVSTTMEAFKMCPNCQREYNDPKDRRFHAQPNCCPACGPSIKLLQGNGEEVQSLDPTGEVLEFIKQGKILAVKGLGGFHLACNAENKNAIEILRLRKNRPHKPFAIMVKDIETAKKLCIIGSEEEKLLLSNKRPIVLLNKRNPEILPGNIAPNVNRLGIMLPYTPLHYLLFDKGVTSLIMTSGNMSTSPIQYENESALAALGKIADYFLMHNRDIHIPIEDSVVKVVERQEVVVRRARGYTPFAIDMKVGREILALGSELKNTFSISQNGYGYMSQYLGDLKDYDAYTAYGKAIDNLTGIMKSKPKIKAHGLHFDCLSSQFFSYGIDKKVSVQHHHAHMASCMVEHKLYDPVIGVIFDGTGLGLDGNIWGGEFFVGTRRDFMRAGHFKYVSIQGGDQAIREPWRIALSFLHSINHDSSNLLKGIGKDAVNTVKQALESKLNCFLSSSVGRLFDCIASLLNIRQQITYEGQGAIELENILEPSIADSYDFHIDEGDGAYNIRYESILLGVLKDIEMGTPASVISSKFHNTVGNSTLEMVCKIRDRYGIESVVLSGGVFENNYLLCYVLKKVREKGFKVYYNQQVPINDGGISVGQLAIADALEGE